DDFALDTLAGVEYLKTRKDIDAKKIGLCGHSEGGVIAPMLAARTKDVAFIVLLAGTGLPGDQILYFQNAIDDEHVQKSAIAREARTLTERIFAILKGDTIDATAQKQLRELLAQLPEIKSLPREQAHDVVEAKLRVLTLPWLRRFLALDPRDALRK